MSLVGFRITNYNGHEDDTIDFLKKVCMFEDPDTAKNIVKAGADKVNVFSSCITTAMLNSQPFSWSPIEVTGKNVLLVSLVNFRLEIFYKGICHVLLPAEYIAMPMDDVSEYSLFIKQGFLGAILSDGGGGGGYGDSISLRPTIVYFSGKGGTKSITVIANNNWSVIQ